MRIFQKILAIVLVIASVISCSDDSDGKKSDSALKESIEGKWIVTSSSGRVSSDSYESFEFNLSGNFIIVIDGEVIFGIYEVIDDETIELEDYGTFKLVSVDGSSISFTFTPDSGDEITFTADKAPQVENSSKTKLLCKTWELVELDGEPVAGTDYELTVLFSDAGTYYVSITGLATWQWKDNDETTICYSWEGDPTCTESNQAIIHELTNNKLVISDLLSDYELKPATNAGRKSKTSGVNFPKGIFHN
ncbi:MAG TPA: hypothetical protein VGK59_17310 [Ohtaekwangia sp.]